MTARAASRAGTLTAAAVGGTGCATDHTSSPPKSTFFGEPADAAAPVGSSPPQ